MPSSYLIEVPRRIVFSRGWGSLTDADITCHAETLRADRRFDAAFRQVVDFREVREIRVTSAGIQRVAAQNPFRPDARRGFVVALDQDGGRRLRTENRTSSDEVVSQLHTSRSATIGSTLVARQAGM